MACIGDSRKLRLQSECGRDFNQEQIEEEILDVLRSGSARLEEQNRPIREIVQELKKFADWVHNTHPEAASEYALRLADRLERVISDNDTT